MNEKRQGKLAVLFPGQGSHFVGMGKEFLHSDHDAAVFLEKAETICGLPVSRLIQEGPLEELTRAKHLQPALTVMNLICWQALEKAGIMPDFAAGHSLGEYSALCAGGILTPESTLALVTERGRLMEREGRKNPGAMAAVLGLTLTEVEELLAALSTDGIVTVANHNTEKQVVIAGEVHALEAATEAVHKKGGKVIKLNVSIANHSPLVRDAVPDFVEIMKEVNFKSPTIPILFNVTAATESDPGTIRDIMARQIASRVRWLDIMKTLMAENVRTFIEAGPKTVLSGLLKKILPRDYEYTIFQIDTPEKLAACREEIG